MTAILTRAESVDPGDSSLLNNSRAPDDPAGPIATGGSRQWSGERLGWGQGRGVFVFTVIASVEVHRVAVTVLVVVVVVLFVILLCLF